MVALTRSGFAKLSRSLNFRAHFKSGCGVHVWALNSVLNPTLFDYAHISNNKRFKCVRKLTGSLLRSIRLSGALGGGQAQCFIRINLVTRENINTIIATVGLVIALITAWNQFGPSPDRLDIEVTGRVELSAQVNKIGYFPELAGEKSQIIAGPFFLEGSYIQ